MADIFNSLKLLLVSFYCLKDCQSVVQAFRKNPRVSEPFPSPSTDKKGTTYCKDAEDTKVGSRTLNTYIFFGRFRVRPFLGPVHRLTAKPRKPWVSEILSPALPFPQFEPFLHLPQSYSSQSFFKYPLIGSEMQNVNFWNETIFHDSLCHGADETVC